MFRPEATYGPGDTIKLALAHPFDPVEIAPIRGEHELWIATRRKPGMSAIALETLILRAGMIDAESNPSQWLIGDRNRVLLAILSAGYGAPDELWVTCPNCSEMHEVPFDPAQIFGQPASDADAFDVDLPDGMSQARLPVAADIEAARGDGEVLRAICAPDLPLDIFDQEVANRDPCSELRFSLACVACGNPFKGALDPLTLLLAELDRHGGVLAEIDLLAQVYHWSEADLIALPAWRRRLYFRQHAAERMAS